MLDLLSLPLLALTTLICLWVFYRHASGVDLLRFPFLVSGVYLAYIFPKLFGLLSSDANLAEVYRQSGAANTLVVSATLCYFGGLAGYYMARPRAAFVPRPLELSNTQYSRVLIIAIVFLAISYAGITGLALTAGGFTQFFFQMESYSLDWRGAEVYYIFIARLIYIPIFLLLILHKARPGRLTLLLIVIALIYPTLNVLVLFRRSEVLLTGSIIAFVAILYYRFRPRRITVMAAVCAMVAVVALFPEIRGSQYRGQDLQQGFIEERLDRFVRFEPNNEIAMAAFLVQRAKETGDFGHGTIFWNALVSQFVPAGLVGRDVKSALYINHTVGEFNVSGWSRAQHFYLAPIGFSQAFEQFGYFGFLLFSALGAMMGALERWRRHSFPGEMMYVLMLAPIVLAVSNDLQLPIVKFATYAVVFAMIWGAGQMRVLSGIAWHPARRLAYGPPMPVQG
jgi:hypothetical protein